MCLIVFGLNVHPNYRLVLAANRDEFYDRPTEPAAFWNDEPEILAGRDLVRGGTWLGVTKTGRFAAVTNFRDPTAPAGIMSRGDLTRDFLKGNETAEKFVRRVENRQHEYSGFNLLVGNFADGESGLFYFSNRGSGPEDLLPGVYGLSNSLINVPWPKVGRAKTNLAKSFDQEEIENAALISMLADRTLAEDDQLPDTGIGIERERALSSAFIETKVYGTRSTSTLKIDRSGRAEFTETTYVGTTGFVAYDLDFKR